MEPFIDRLAVALLKDHQHELDQVAVVLPGRRAGLHLQKALAARCGRTIWSPEMLNMGSLLQRISGLRQGEGMEMIFMLHDAHRAVMGDRSDPLAEFLQWAPVTLRDMSELDAHLADLDDVYRDLRSFHEIEEWSFRLGELSEGQQRLAQQWRATGEMHRRMHRLMDERGIGTSGWLARRTAEEVARSIDRLPWKKVWLAGMNALDPASTKVLRALQQNGKLTVAWDADRYYLQEHHQEAGIFLRRSIADLGEGVIPPIQEIKERRRTMHLVAVPHAVAQARYAAQLIADLSEEERGRTCIVLAAEELLMPLLDALPKSSGPFNVTMGMPLASLPVHGLVEAFLQFQASHQQGAGFHHGDLERLLLHPFVHHAISPAILAVIREEQRSRVTAERLGEIIASASISVPEEMLHAIQPAANLPELQQRIIDLIGWARRICSTDRFATEQLFRMAQLQQRLDRALQRSAGQTSIDIRSYIALRTRVLREESIGFFGEALSGTQIMGSLETRALDHERVIVLGCNDGVLPASGATQSWIPFELRKAWGLPLHGDREAITAYHFQRMMHLAEDVYLVYDTSSRNGSAGPSRYIEQWRHELIGRSGTTLIEHTVTASFNQRNTTRISIRKNEKVLAKLRKIGERGFSPSAISAWITCPLDLYFKYVLGIRAQEEVDEKLGGDVLGEAVHAIAEQIYQPLIGTVITPEVLLEPIAAIDAMLIEHLRQKFPMDALRSGHFRLRIEMASKALAAYLEAEAARCRESETVPLLLEADVCASLPNGMRIRGRCDRIELRDGVHHILDVKTGSVQPFNVDLKRLDRELVTPEKKFGLQLLMYSWAFMMEHPEVAKVRAGIIPLQKASLSGGLLLQLEGKEDIHRSDLPAITTLLTALVDEVLDPSIPFSHTAESLYCGCCVG